MTNNMESLMDEMQSRLRFTIKKQLTRLVGMNGWIIYRDPENGLYALAPNAGQYGVEVNLGYWNITMNDPKLEQMVLDIRRQIADAVEEQTEEFTDADIVIHEGGRR